MKKFLFSVLMSIIAITANAQLKLEHTDIIVCKAGIGFYNPHWQLIRNGDEYRLEATKPNRFDGIFVLHIGNTAEEALCTLTNMYDNTKHVNKKSKYKVYYISDSRNTYRVNLRNTKWYFQYNDRDNRLRSVELPKRYIDKFIFAMGKR